MLEYNNIQSTTNSFHCYKKIYEIGDKINGYTKAS